MRGGRSLFGAPPSYLTKCGSHVREHDQPGVLVMIAPENVYAIDMSS